MSPLQSRTTRPPMFSISRRIAAAVVVATMMLVAACSSDNITSPTSVRAPAPAEMKQSLTDTQAALLAKLMNRFLSNGLQRITPLAHDVVVTTTLGRAGGTIEIPESGLTLEVPRGAILTGRLTITVTALAGSTIAYEFEPHGTVFARPLSVEQSLEGTRLGLLDITRTLRGGYFKDINQVDLSTGRASLDEIYPILLRDKKASFDISHFSGYMVSMD